MTTRRRKRRSEAQPQLAASWHRRQAKAQLEEQQTAEATAVMWSWSCSCRPSSRAQREWHVETRAAVRCLLRRVARRRLEHEPSSAQEETRQRQQPQACLTTEHRALNESTLALCVGVIPIHSISVCVGGRRSLVVHNVVTRCRRRQQQQRQQQRQRQARP